MESDRLVCEICDRQANYLCGQCQVCAYCTNEHRIEHWRVHKEQCKIMTKYKEIQMEEEIDLKRTEMRKKYFESYVNKMYDKSLVYAKEMIAFEKTHIEMTRNIKNEFEYGITTTLLCRTLILLKKDSQASVVINEYLKEKYHFLEDMRDIPRFQARNDSQDNNSGSVSESSKEFLKKKLSLISSVANIYHSLSLSPIEFYNIYLNHIQLAFGEQSLEVSNCYFLIGTYYMQTNEFNKSVACFVKCAGIRGPKGGDCYYNLAILYQMKNKLDVSIKLFEMAIKLKGDEQGENSIEVAKTYETIAHIQITNNNLKGAVKAYENALKVYSNKNEMKEYSEIKEKIRDLHQHIKEMLQYEDRSLFPKQIQDLMPENKTQQIRNINQNQAEEQTFVVEEKKRFAVENLIKFGEGFLNRLKPAEIYRLSELQLELEKCNSEFGVANTVVNSEFLKNLGENRLKEFKRENEKLFELMNIEKKFF